MGSGWWWWWWWCWWVVGGWVGWVGWWGGGVTGLVAGGVCQAALGSRSRSSLAGRAPHSPTQHPPCRSAQARRQSSVMPSPLVVRAMASSNTAASAVGKKTAATAVRKRIVKTKTAAATAVSTSGAKKTRAKNAAVAAATSPSSSRAVDMSPRRRLRVGSHCSGWMTDSLALENLAVPHKIVMASDVSPSVKQLVQQNFEVETWYDDMTKVSVSKMPGKLDLYSCGFPCQPYSAAGKGLGLGDARATPLHVLLQYVARHRPNMVLLENVEAFSRGKHKEAFELVLKRLRDFGVYEAHHNIVNTLDHGVAQHRRRVFIVCIKRSMMQKPFSWPQSLPHQASLSGCYDRDRSRVIIKMQSIEAHATSHNTSVENLHRGFKKIQKLGKVPKKVDAIIDIGSSPRFAQCAIGYSPTLTYSRCKDRGYYATRLMRRLSVSEMIRLQGMDPRRLDTTGIRDTDMGGIVGNAMSVNVATRILKKMLESIDW